MVLWFGNWNRRFFSEPLTLLQFWRAVFRLKFRFVTRLPGLIWNSRLNRNSMVHPRYLRVRKLRGCCLRLLGGVASLFSDCTSVWGVCRAHKPFPKRASPFVVVLLLALLDWAIAYEVWGCRWQSSDLWQRLWRTPACFCRPSITKVKSSLQHQTPRILRLGFRVYGWKTNEFSRKKTSGFFVTLFIALVPRNLLSVWLICSKTSESRYQEDIRFFFWVFSGRFYGSFACWPVFSRNLDLNFEPRLIAWCHFLHGSLLFLLCQSNHWKRPHQLVKPWIAAAGCWKQFC